MSALLRHRLHSKLQRSSTVDVLGPAVDPKKSLVRSESQSPVVRKPVNHGRRLSAVESIPNKEKEEVKKCLSQQAKFEQHVLAMHLGDLGLGYDVNCELAAQKLYTVDNEDEAETVDEDFVPRRKSSSPAVLDLVKFEYDKNRHLPKIGCGSLTATRNTSSIDQYKALRKSISFTKTLGF